jgi:hypothetical protein
MTVAVEFSKSWRDLYPDAVIGVLAQVSVGNGPPSHRLRERLQAIEVDVRSRYAGKSRPDLQALPRARPYVDHYRRFGKTYHVLLQLESVAFRGRPLAAATSLVSAMFGAEIDSLLLTAGHDLTIAGSRLLADVTRQGETYVGITETEVAVKAGDMSIRGPRGILSTVLYGPDHDTRLRPDTGSVLFTTYAPAGIEATQLEQHLKLLEELVLIDSPSAKTIFAGTFRSAPG